MLGVTSAATPACPDCRFSSSRRPATSAFHSACPSTSRTYSRTSRDLEAKLTEVEALSAEAIEHAEREAELRAENERRARELEEARQPERFNASGEMLDYDRARVVFAESAHESANTIVDRFVHTSDTWADGYPQDDDVTFVVLKVRESDGQEDAPNS